MASEFGRGAQVRLDGDGRQYARGGTALRLIDNIREKLEEESAGSIADGNTPDGSTRTGTAAEDEVFAPGGGLVTSIADEATARIAGDAVNAAVISTHSARTDNPHAVTAAQIGAYSTATADTLLATKAPLVHTHATADVTGLDTALAGKAATSHTHATSDVTGLVTALAGKAAASHGHIVTDVTGLQTALDGKAATTHTHGIADLTATGTRDTTTYLRGDNTWAVPAGGGGATGLITSSSRTSNTQLTATDAGKLIVASGTFTQTFAAAATLGASWSAYLSNEGTGILTLDPSGSETIDGLTSINVYPGEGFLIQCDGTALRTVGRSRVVLIHAGSIAGAVAAYDIEAPFTDAELRRIEVEVAGLSHNGGTTQSLALRVKKGGAYLTAGYGGRAMLNAFSNINNAAYLSFIATSLIAASVQISARIAVHNLKTSGTGQLFDMTARQQGNNNGTTGVAYNVTGDVATSGAVQGIRFMATTDSLNSGDFSAWGYR